MASGGQAAPRYSAGDRIQIALIGAGIMGMGDVRQSLLIPGVELVAVSDVYDGRLKRARELWGKRISTTRDYRKILARKDVDAVIIATPDHWHSQITIEALAAGKDVYCEKPMVQKIEQGLPVIEAARKSGRVLQIGSQYVASLHYQKARELLMSGAIGELNMVEAWMDRNSAEGAWQYPIPPDASPETVDWDRFLGAAPHRPFDALRVFRWRNYVDYGTGVAGDLFVHLLSGLHFATGSLGPTRIFATGGLRYWKDGREVPDVMLATMDYPKTAAHPEFTLAMRVDFKSGAPEDRFGMRLLGSEGVLTTGLKVALTKRPREKGFDYSLPGFPKRIREQVLAAEPQEQPGHLSGQTEEVFTPPAGYNSQREHLRVFYEAVRSRQPVIEDATFGLRAAAPALLANASYAEQRACSWNPAEMKEA
jgi:predicted dehydrogenase